MGRVVPVQRAAWWVPVSVGLFTLGWAVTTAFGVDVERQYAVFGATGALAAAIGGALALAALRRPAADYAE